MNYKPEPDELTNREFTRLTVLGKQKIGVRFWLICKCSCGWVGKYRRGSILKETTRSCGCLAAELSSGRNKTHGGSRLPEYQIWRGIKRRCDPETADAHPDYSGRGIRVCRRWRNSFACFFEDMGKRPIGRELDRKNNLGHYSCGKCDQCERRGWVANCRWVTRNENNQNKRNNINVTYRGKTQCYSAWARELGVRRGALRNRILREGADVAIERTIAAKGARLRRQDGMITFNDKTMSAIEWAALLGICRDTLYYRIEKWGIERALSTPKQH